MASLILTVKGADVTALKKASTLKNEGVQGIINHLAALASGANPGTIYAQSSASNPVAASGTITLVSCATDTVTIGGVAFTGSSTPSGDEQFETDGSNDADASALAAKINAHPTLSKVVAATVANNVVTVTCLVRGVVGNFIALSETGSTITVSGATLSGGTGGATDSESSWAFGQ
jgi:phage tail sheath gpL-like